MNQTTFGSVRLQTAQAFTQSGAATPEEQVQQALAALKVFGTGRVVSHLPSVSDWRITDCVQRDIGISLQAETAAGRVLLRFDPAGATDGDYEIHLPAHRRHENGRVEAVFQIDANDLWMREYAMLTSFPIRYLVRTGANDRQRTQQVWLVGISSFRQLSAQTTDSDA